MDIPTTDFVRAGSLEELKAKGRLVMHPAAESPDLFAARPNMHGTKLSSAST